MAISKQNKHLLAMLGTGALALGLAVFAFIRNGNANSAKRDAERAKTELIDSYKEKAALRKDSIATHDTLCLVRNENDSLRTVIIEKDSVIADRDTAIAVLGRELKDCEENKKPVAKKPAQTKKPAAKPVEKKPEVKKPEAKKPEAKKPEAKKPEEKKPEVKQPVCDKKPVAPVHVDFNDDSHDNVVNVNNGIVINNNYNAVVDTIKAAQKKVQYSVGKAYTGRTVRCQ
ncbi:MAG: hypothetical protein IKP05_02890 [Alphaproteobacteria bacterium]|nr:hypothetical protein [Alphaproteobacteria bacterium]